MCLVSCLSIPCTDLMLGGGGVLYPRNEHLVMGRLEWMLGVQLLVAGFGNEGVDL